jgi:hypothetical protein
MKASPKREMALFAPDPEEDDAFVIAPTKANLGPRPDSLRYRIVGPKDAHGHIEWRGVAEGLTADQLADLRRQPRSKTDDAEDWLRELLSDAPQESKHVKLGAEARGYGERALRDAREKLGVVIKHEGRREHKKTFWSLPADRPPDGRLTVDFSDARRGAR